MKVRTILTQIRVSRYTSYIYPHLDMGQWIQGHINKM